MCEIFKVNNKDNKNNEICDKSNSQILPRLHKREGSMQKPSQLKSLNFIFILKF